MADMNQGADTGATQSAPEGVNWADLAVDADGGDAFVLEPLGADSGTASSYELSGADPVAGQAATSTTPTTPALAPTPATAPAVQPSAEQIPVQQVVQQPTPAQPPATQEPAVNPAELSARYMQGLTTEYGLSQEDALALQTQPETVLPRLAAQMHMRVMQDVVKHVQQMAAYVPQMLQAQLAQQEAENSAKQEFFGEWPGLSAHYQATVQNAMMVRQANPNATKQQVIEMAGMVTAMALGLDPSAVRRQAQAQQVQRQMPAPRATNVPPRPAAVGSGPAALAPQSKSIWGEFADDDINWMNGG